MSLLKHIMETTAVMLAVGVLQAHPSYADRTGYSEVKDLRVETDELIVHHHHDWSEASHEARYKMISGSRDPFTAANTYSFLDATDKRTGSTLFHVPVPALTYVWISPDSRYIVGLSKIKLWNPFQLVFLDRNGRLLHKEHIAEEEACLGPTQYADFRARYPDAERLLREWSTVVGDMTYFDFERMGVPRDIGDSAFRYLVDHACPSHHSSNFTGSVSNWVFWYDENDPQLTVEMVDDAVVGLSLLDPTGKRFTVPIGAQARRRA